VGGGAGKGGGVFRGAFGGYKDFRRCLRSSERVGLASRLGYQTQKNGGGFYGFVGS